MEGFKMASADAEYLKYKDLKKQDVEHLKDWVEKQPHLPKMEELQIILFLHSCYFSIEQAKTTIDNYFTMKTHCPELFAKRDPCMEYAKEFMDAFIFDPLPILTPEGYKIIYIKPMDANGSHFVFTDQLKLLDMNVILWLHTQGSEEGMVMFIDLDIFGFGHMARLHIVGMKKLFFYLQEALPVRLKAMHFINMPPFMDVLLNMMKPFMKKGLMEKVYQHNSLDRLFEVIPKECLPSNYGGPLDSAVTIHENMKKRLIANRAYYKYEEQQVADESKREGKPKNAGDIFGIEGSFKKLDID